MKSAISARHAPTYAVQQLHNNFQSWVAKCHPTYNLQSFIGVHFYIFHVFSWKSCIILAEINNGDTEVKVQPPTSDFW